MVDAVGKHARRWRMLEQDEVGALALEAAWGLGVRGETRWSGDSRKTAVLAVGGRGN